MIATIDKQEISISINNTVEEIDRAVWLLGLMRKEHDQEVRSNRPPSERPIERFFNELYGRECREDRLSAKENGIRMRKARFPMDDSPLQMNLRDRF